MQKRTGPAICRSKSYFSFTPLKIENCLLKYVSLRMQQMSLDVAKTDNVFSFILSRFLIRLLEQ